MRSTASLFAVLMVGMAFSVMLAHVIISTASAQEQTTPAAPIEVTAGESSVKDVTDGVGQVIEGVKSGSWSAIAGGIIFLLTALFKLPLLGGLVRKIPSRIRIVIPIALGACAGLVAAIAGGMPWYEACYVWLFSSGSGVFAHELIAESIFGKPAEAGARR